MLQLRSVLFITLATLTFCGTLRAQDLPADQGTSTPADYFEQVVASYNGLSVPCCDSVESAAPCCAAAIAPWVTLRIDGGNGVGYVDGFAYLDGFLPLYQPTPDSIVFGNMRVVNYLNANRWEFQGGLGYRVFQPEHCQILGVNVYYDGRNTEATFYNQIGFGVELVRERWETRANGYYVFNNNPNLLSVGGIIGQQGNILSRSALYNVALSGFDWEIGGPIPGLEPYNVRGFVGMYYYSNGHINIPDALGVEGRVEAEVCRNVTFHAAVRHDDLFDTTASAGFAVHFGGPRCCRVRSLRDRLGDRVVRDPNVVTIDANGTATEPAPQPSAKKEEN